MGSWQLKSLSLKPSRMGTELYLGGKRNIVLIMFGHKSGKLLLVSSGQGQRPHLRTFFHILSQGLVYSSVVWSMACALKKHLIPEMCDYKPVYRLGV